MQVLKENFAEGAALEPTTPGTVESEKKGSQSTKSSERPSTLEGMLHRLFASVTRKENCIKGDHYNK
jgi:hypothetical protein